MAGYCLGLSGSAGRPTAPAWPRAFAGVVRSAVGSPCVAHASLAAVALRPVRKRAIERGADREPVHEYDIGASGDQNGIASRRGAGDGEGRAGQRLEAGNDARSQREIMRPGDPAVQPQRLAIVDGDALCQPDAEFGASRIGRAVVIG